MNNELNWVETRIIKSKIDKHGNEIVQLNPTLCLYKNKDLIIIVGYDKTQGFFYDNVCHIYFDTHIKPALLENIEKYLI